MLYSSVVVDQWFNDVVWTSRDPEGPHQRGWTAKKPLRDVRTLWEPLRMPRSPLRETLRNLEEAQFHRRASKRARPLDCWPFGLLSETWTKRVNSGQEEEKWRGPQKVKQPKDRASKAQNEKLGEDKLTRNKQIPCSEEVKKQKQTRLAKDDSLERGFGKRLRASCKW